MVARGENVPIRIGRFIAVLRAWAAFLAGVNHMHWRTFLIYNAAGGIVWATIFGTFGFVAGRFFHDNFAQVERLATTVGWFGKGLIVAAVLAVFIVFRVRKHKRARAPAGTKAIEEKKKEELKTGLKFTYFRTKLHR